MYSFDIPDYEKELKEYLVYLKRKRILSKKIKELLIEDLNKNRDIKSLKKKLISLEKECNEEKEKILKQIEKSKKRAKEIYEDTLIELKKHYDNNKVSSIGDVGKFIDFNSQKISEITGEGKDKLINKIVKEIEKWGKIQQKNHS